MNTYFVAVPDAQTKMLFEPKTGKQAEKERKAQARAESRAGIFNKGKGGKRDRAGKFPPVGRMGVR